MPVASPREQKALSFLQSQGLPVSPENISRVMELFNTSNPGVNPLQAGFTGGGESRDSFSINDLNLDGPADTAGPQTSTTERNTVSRDTTKQTNAVPSSNEGSPTTNQSVPQNSQTSGANGSDTVDIDSLLTNNTDGSAEGVTLPPPIIPGARLPSNVRTVPPVPQARPQLTSQASPRLQIAGEETAQLAGPDRLLEAPSPRIQAPNAELAAPLPQLTGPQGSTVPQDVDIDRLITDVETDRLTLDTPDGPQSVMRANFEGQPVFVDQLGRIYSDTGQLITTLAPDELNQIFNTSPKFLRFVLGLARR